MPSVERAGVVGKYIELPPDLVKAVEELAVRRGNKFREEVIDALRRHIAYPPSPPPAPEPLPQTSGTNQPPSVKRGRGRPKKGGQT